MSIFPKLAGQKTVKHLSPFTDSKAVLGVQSKLLAAARLQGWVLGEDTRSCPVPDAANSSWLQQTHWRTQMSPSGGASVISYHRKSQRERRREQKMRKSRGNTKVKGGAPGWSRYS